MSTKKISLRFKKDSRDPGLAGVCQRRGFNIILNGNVVGRVRQDTNNPYFGYISKDESKWCIWFGGGNRTSCTLKARFDDSDQAIAFVKEKWHLMSHRAEDAHKEENA